MVKISRRKNKIDITKLISQKFSLLQIQKAWRDKNNIIRVKCICDCGNEWSGKYNELQTFKSRSCGCQWKLAHKKDWLF